MVPDQSGGIYIVWAASGGFSVPLGAPNAGNHGPGGGPSPNNNLYATRLNASGDVVPGWSANVGHDGLLLITDRFDQNTTIRPYPDGSGGFILGWSTSSANTTGKLFAQRYSSGGAGLWTGSGDGTSGSKAVELSGSSTLVGDCAVSGDQLYYIVRQLTGLGVAAINISDGSQKYSSQSIPNFPSLVAQGGLAPSPDNNDPGAILFLQANFSPPEYDLEAWRFNAMGLQWGPAAVTNDGSVDVSGGGSAAFPARDGTGNIYVVWYDTRAASPGIYGARVGISSTSFDQVNGHLIATTLNNAAPQGLTGHDRVAAAAGGFAITWSTSSDSGSHGFIQIVNPASNWSKALGNSGADLGQENRVVVVGVSGSSSQPIFWAAQSGNRGAIQAFDSAGSDLFPSTFPFTQNPVSSGSVLPAAAIGLGDHLALAFMEFGDCGDPSTCYGDLYYQVFAATPVKQAAGVVASDGASLTFPLSNGTVLMTIPPATFTSSVTVKVAIQSTFPAAGASPNAALTGTGVGISISLDRPGLQPKKPVTLSIGYENTSLASTPDLVIARYDDLRSRWVPLASTPDLANKLVTALTDRFSTFQIMQAVPAAGVSKVKVFPNPFIPASGHAGVTFSNMPAVTTLRIFTLNGENVRELSSSASGMAFWDGKNSAGVRVSSGVYFVLIKSGSSSKTVKVAVQR